MACSQRPILAAHGENGRMEGRERGVEERKEGEAERRRRRRADQKGTPATDQSRAQSEGGNGARFMMEDCVWRTCIEV